MRKSTFCGDRCDILQIGLKRLYCKVYLCVLFPQQCYMLTTIKMHFNTGGFILSKVSLTKGGPLTRLRDYTTSCDTECQA